jgi:hypothetical protein
MLKTENIRLVMLRIFLLTVTSVFFSLNIQAQILLHGDGYNTPVSIDSIMFSTSLYPKLNPVFVTEGECGSIEMLKTRTTWLGSKIHNEHLLRVDSSNYSLIIDPILHFSVGNESRYDPMLYENTRGVRFSGHLHQQLLFSSEIYETQIVFPDYLEAFTDSFGVAPGLMRAKKFKENGRDVSQVFGALAWVPSSSFSLVFARDKQHYGYGYRSMMFSNSAPASTFIRVSAERKSWSYDFILASLQNLPLNNVLNVPMSSLGGFQNKYANFIVLSKRFYKRFEISLFESMVWAPYNDRYNSLHPKFFNPVPLVRTAWYGLDDRNNTSAGIQFAATLPANMFFYSQYVIDDAEKPVKTSFQAGLKYAVTKGRKTVFQRIEFNTSGAYTYSHSNQLQSYSHYHHSIAHPFGANFRELLSETAYRNQRWLVYAFISYIYGGADTQYESTGQSIYSDPDFANWNGSFFPALTKTNSSVLFVEMRLHYTINNCNGLNAFVSSTYRNARNTPFPRNSTEINIGISTSLRHYTKHLSWL